MQFTALHCPARKDQSPKSGNISAYINAYCQTPDFLFLLVQQMIEEIRQGSIFGLFFVWFVATLGDYGFTCDPIFL